MGLKLFFHNLKYLGQINLKHLKQEQNKISLDDIYTNVNLMLDNQRYELPNNPYQISKPAICGFEETLDALLASDASFIRFGDGEVFLIEGKSIGFQKANPQLSKRLREILRSQEKNIFIGINYHYYYADLSNFHDYVKFVYRSFITPIREMLSTHLLANKNYYATGVTGLYNTVKNYDFETWFAKWRKLWEGKEITVICGDRVFKNIHHNIFDNARSIHYQYIPSADAFASYDKILQQANTISSDRLIILIAGPTAKPLAFDLARQGRRVLDLGHLAKDYDAYRKAMKTDKITIGKFYEPD